jgi:hypothetical protein
MFRVIICAKIKIKCNSYSFNLKPGRNPVFASKLLLSSKAAAYSPAHKMSWFYTAKKFPEIIAREPLLIVYSKM